MLSQASGNNNSQRRRLLLGAGGIVPAPDFEDSSSVYGRLAPLASSKISAGTITISTLQISSTEYLFSFAVQSMVRHLSLSFVNFYLIDQCDEESSVRLDPQYPAKEINQFADQIIRNEHTYSSLVIPLLDQSRRNHNQCRTRSPFLSVGIFPGRGSSRHNEGNRDTGLARTNGVTQHSPTQRRL